MHFVRVFMRKIFVQFFSHGSLDSFENRAFDIGVPTDLKLCPRVSATFEMTR